MGGTDAVGSPLGPYTVGHKSRLHGSVWAAELTGQAASIADLVKKIGIYFARPIVDETGIEGSYDFKVSFGWPLDGPKITSTETDEGHASSLVASLRNQLGLWLEGRTAVVKVLVVEQAERASVE
jgi:uncharacterized protein (TIGR03435 family)